MGIARLITVSMMFAMVCGPADRSAFTCQRAHKGQAPAQPFGDVEAGVSEKSMEAEANSKAARNPVHKDR
jgi:hypothetical protein